MVYYGNQLKSDNWPSMKSEPCRGKAAVYFELDNRQVATVRETERFAFLCADDAKADRSPVRTISDTSLEMPPPLR